MSELDLIDDYLDRLVETLNGPGAEVRRALAESEDHLREVEAEGIRTGRAPGEAAAMAIDRFGTPEEVARRYDLMRALASPGQVIAQVALSMMLVGALVLISIGVSGALAAASSAVWGPAFVAGDLPGVTYTAERCDDFLRFHPKAAGCAEAAVLHHFDETVGFRADAGILGLILIGGWWLIRKKTTNAIGPRAIPEVFVPVAATALFAAAAFVLGGMGTIQLLSTGTDSGAGYFVTAGLVALVATAGFGVWLVRSLSARNEEPGRT